MSRNLRGILLKSRRMSTYETSKFGFVEKYQPKFDLLDNRFMRSSYIWLLVNSVFPKEESFAHIPEDGKSLSSDEILV
jgi:hypothetical protein